MTLSGSSFSNNPFIPTRLPSVPNISTKKSNILPSLSFATLHTYTQKCATSAFRRQCFTSHQEKLNVDPIINMTFHIFVLGRYTGPYDDGCGSLSAEDGTQDLLRTVNKGIGRAVLWRSRVPIHPQIPFSKLNSRLRSNVSLCSPPTEGKMRNIHQFQQTNLCFLIISCLETDSSAVSSIVVAIGPTPD